MSEYREVATPKPSDKGKGTPSIVTYEDGNEPEVHECNSKGALIGFLMRLLPKNTEFRGDGRTNAANLR